MNRPTDDASRDARHDTDARNNIRSAPLRSVDLCRYAAQWSKTGW